MRSSVLAVASSLVLAGVPQVTHAAGLGRLVVFSALGQPLRAEIEVTATREELADMKARLASPETFKQAGLDYATTLLSVRFNLEKRPNGQAVIRLTSDRPINDPFLDMLLELNWATGRLVREYTFLLDPPEYAAKTPVPAVVSAPVGRPAPGASSAIDGDVRARAAAQQRAQQQAAPQKPAEPAPRAGEGREVKRGETLHRIASETKLEGISLDQMLVGLFRANPGAFEGGNMNRLRAGTILSIPDKSAVESVSPGEARKIVVAQSSDWNAYRSKLAGIAVKSPARDDAARQESSGKITAKVDDKTEQASPKDQLKVSRAEPASGKGGAAAAKESDEDLIAKDKALQEANKRMAALEKNVADLQKLLELKNQSLADLQKQASATPAGTVPAVKPEEAATAKPAEAPKAAEPAPAPAAAQSPAPAPEAAPAKVELPPAPVAKPPETPPQSAPKPAEKPKVAAPPPPEEPGFFADLLGNTTTLVGGGGILALIAAYLFMRRRRSMAEAPERDLSSTLTPPSTTGLTANSVFRNTGGQSVDTSSQAPAQTDFSQAGPGSIDTDEVDPVAEADVYMAYGRDAQAEEILLEARQKDPKRAAIAVKLLEIYSGRKDVKQFETLATDLYGETCGVGPDWEKAAAMGRLLDPNNPIFRGTVSSTLAAGIDAAKSGSENGGSSVPAAPVAAAVAGTAAAAMSSLDFDLGDYDSKAESLPEPAPAPSGKVPPLPETLDFDLGGDAGPDAASAAEPVSGAPLADAPLPEEPWSGAPEVTAAQVEAPDLDFDIGTKIAPLTETLDRQEDKAQLADLDFDLGGDSVVPGDYGKAAGVAQLPADGLALGDDAVEFDVSLTESTFLGRLPPEPSSFDMASIDLDLQSPDFDIAGLEEQQAPAAEERAFEGVQVSTAVNPDFASEQLETVVTPSGFDATQGDTALNPDFASEQMETLVVPGVPDSQSETALNFELANQQAETIVSPSVAGSSQDLAADLDIAPSEEVATKLDLAKAYEEMGDVEGARELLQEVLREGNAGQREAAQEMLARVGG